MGLLKKIAVGVAIIVIGGLVMLFLTTAYNEYAEVGYQLHGPSSFDQNYQSSLPIDLNQENTGKVSAVPISKICVLNGTIIQVSINGVPQSQVSEFCWFNETMAIIGNLTISKERTLSTWAVVSIVPNEGVLSFSIRAEVSLETDWLHPRNSVHVVIPNQLVYNQTGVNAYSLLS